MRSTTPVGQSMLRTCNFLPNSSRLPDLAMPRILASMLLLVVLATPLAAQEKVQVTVDAGEHDRQQTPVKLLITVPEQHAKRTVVTLTRDGKTLVGQLTQPGLLTDAGKNELARELHFILPELKKGESATYEVTFADPPAVGVSFQWEDTAGKHMDLKLGDKPVLRYMYERVDNSSPARRAETFKVYHHVYNPAGTRLLTKGAGGLFPHHRGVFYGFNRISYGDGKTADTWHCNNGESQTHEGFLAQEAGPVLARHTLAIDWHGKKDDVFAKEKREMTVYNTAGGTLIEFASRLESAVGPVKLDGDPQHAGFQFRASQDVPDKTAKQTYYVRPDGAGKPGQFRNWDPKKPDAQHTNLPWNALSIVLDDQRYTICYLDRPENPKEARFSERDYGRFGSYFEYQLDEGKPLDLNYRLWVQEGEMKVDEVDARSKGFVAPPKAKTAG